MILDLYFFRGFFTSLLLYLVRFVMVNVERYRKGEEIWGKLMKFEVGFGGYWFIMVFLKLPQIINLLLNCVDSCCL